MIEISPITFKEAKKFVNEHHRHNVAPQGQKFSIGVKEDGALIGVVTVGRPIARRNDDGVTAEITRCCVIEGHKNANSLLYAAAWRAARSMGYHRIITYTLPTESGASLRAAGFVRVGMTEGKANGWSVPSRPREMPENIRLGRKLSGRSSATRKAVS